MNGLLFYLELQLGGGVGGLVEVRRSLVSVLKLEVGTTTEGRGGGPFGSRVETPRPFLFLPGPL